MPGYYCPTRRDPPQLSTTGDDRRGLFPKSIPGALADYASCMGDGNWAGTASYPINPLDANGAITFATCAETGTNPNFRYPSWYSNTSFRSLTDGTSCTILIGEKHVHQQYQGVAKFANFWFYDNSAYNDDYEFTSARIAGPGYGIAKSPLDLTIQFYNFGSWHASVCQFVMADGSVRGVTPTISTTILGLLANRSDGQPVPENSF